MKKVGVLWLVILIAACGGDRGDAGGMDEGQGMMADSAQMDESGMMESPEMGGMEMEADSAMMDPDSGGMGMEPDTTGMAH
jgi:hypothetical protein